MVFEKKLYKLTEKDQKCIKRSVLIWIVAIFGINVWAVVLWPDTATKNTVLIILLVLSIPLTIVGWKAAPLPKKGWDTAAQYQGIKHLRTITGIQAVIGGAALALIFGFEQDDASMSLGSSMLVWTATASFHFLALHYQIKMETPPKLSKL